MRSARFGSVCVAFDERQRRENASFESASASCCGSCWRSENADVVSTSFKAADKAKPKPKRTFAQYKIGAFGVIESQGRRVWRIELAVFHAKTRTIREYTPQKYKPIQTLSGYSSSSVRRAKGRFGYLRVASTNVFDAGRKAFHYTTLGSQSECSGRGRKHETLTETIVAI